MKWVWRTLLFFAIVTGIGLYVINRFTADAPPSNDPKEIAEILKAAEFPEFLMLKSFVPHRTERNADMVSTWGIVLLNKKKPSVSNSLKDVESEIVELFTPRGWRLQKTYSDIDLVNIDSRKFDSGNYIPFLSFKKVVPNGKGQVPTRYAVSFKRSSSTDTLIGLFRVDSE